MSRPEETAAAMRLEDGAGTLEKGLHSAFSELPDRLPEFPNECNDEEVITTLK